MKHYLKLLSLCLIIFLFLTSHLYSEERKSYVFTGEKLYYRLIWKGVDAGYALAKVKEVKYQGQNVLLLETLARSSDSIDSLFKVRDQIQCYWDPERKQALTTIKNLNEGNYRRNYNVHFNYLNNSASYSQKEYKGNTMTLGEKNSSARDELSNKTIFNLPEDIQDVASALYMLRADTREPVSDTSFSIPVFDDSQLSILKINVKEKTIVQTPAGKFETVKIIPEVPSGGFFITHSDISVWITNDKFRIPVKVEVIMPVAGKIVIELVKLCNQSNSCPDSL